jgi:hypothetical protein
MLREDISHLPLPSVLAFRQMGAHRHTVPANPLIRALSLSRAAALIDR